MRFLRLKGVALPTYPESGIKLVADTDSYTTAMEYAIDLADRFDAIGDLVLTVSADASEAASVLDDLPLSNDTIDITVDATLGGDEIPKDETINDTLNITETPSAAQTLGKVDTLKQSKLSTTWDLLFAKDAESFVGNFTDLKGKVISTTWNVVGNGIELLKDFGGKAIDPILKLGDAVAEVGAKTGGAIPNADQLINKIYYSDVGRSKEEVGQMIIAAHGLGLPIEEAVRAAGTFTHTWSDQNSIQAITTFGTLLNTHLVGNMKEASDLMTVFFQEGGNKGGDALQVVNANAESWSNMGLNAKQALSLVSTLLRGNVDNASDAAKMIQTLDDSLTTAATKAGSPQAEMLTKMGLKNPKDSGKAMGAEFIDAFAAAFTNLPADQQDLASGLFMGKGGKKFTGAIEGMTTKSDMFKNVTDQAELAANEIDNSLHGAIDDFVLKANQKMEEFLDSKAIDIPGKIDKLKEGLQKGMDVLAQGGSLSDALTVALKPIGFDSAFQGLESMLGNFVIAILQAVSTLQSLDPKNWDAKKGTDATINKMGATQLTYDLKIANPDQVAGDIGTALSRGVSPEQISKSVGTAVNELIANGQPALAKSLLDSVKSVMQDANANLELTSSGSPVNVNAKPVVSEGDLAEYQSAIDKAYAKTAHNAFTTAENSLPGVFEPVKTGMDGLRDVTANANTHLRDVTGTTKDFGKTATDASNEIGGATYTVSNGSDVATVSLNNMAVAIGDVNNAANGLNAAASHVADVQGTLNGTGGGSSAGIGTHASGGEFVGTSLVGEQGREIVSSDTGLAVLNNATTERLMSALLGYIPGGSFGGKGNVSNTIINQNNIPNIATADALGYKQAETLRGMSGS